MKHKNLIMLLIYLIIFAAIFGIELYDYIIDVAFFSIGIPARMTDIIIIVLCVAAIIKTVWHVHDY